MIRNFVVSAILVFNFIFVLPVVVLSYSSPQEPNQSPKAASAVGILRLGQEDVFVEVFAEVRPGENPQMAATASLKRSYPGVREISSEEYSLTGLFWDVFKDGNPGNDYVRVNYNSNKVASSLSGKNHRSTLLMAMSTWTNVEPSNFKYADGGDTTRCPSLVQECRGPQYFDDNNDIGWIDIKDPSVLGVTWFSVSRDEFDMALDNKNFRWYVGDPVGIPSNYFDVETVWLHEFGHGAGLGHSNVDGAVMEPYYEGVKRSLHEDDINGLNSLYP